MTLNPRAFETAVRAHLEPYRDQFNYDQMLLTFLSVDRFRQWAQVVARYRPVAGARVLSSGCGFGGSLVAYAEAGAAAVTGVDVDPTSVELGRLRVAELPQATVELVAPGPLPFADGAFDVIESVDVIEHTPDPRAYLAELVRVLAPDGLILLVTPNRLWPVEQHLGIAGPPWLPVGLADALFGGLARVPWLGEERRFKYTKLAGMRTHNVSLWLLRALAGQLGLHLRLLRPDQHEGHWPLPRQPAWIERLAWHRVGKFVAPTRTLALTLESRDNGR